MNDSIIGVTVDRTDRDLQVVLDQLRALGINTLFAGEDLTSSGGFRALARKNEIDLFVRIPVFSAVHELAADPELVAVTADGEAASDGGMEYACPSRSDFRDGRIEHARDVVMRLRPEGIILEHAHQFVAWETVELDEDPTTLPETCFCVHCLQGFAAYLGVPPSSIPPQPRRAARWIAANASDRWVEFRVDTITSTVVEIAEAVRDLDANVVLALGVVPWRRDDVSGFGVRVTGQDLPRLSQTVDFLVPMTFAHTLGRPPEWIGSVVRDIDWAVDCPVLPAVQVGSVSDDDEPYPGGAFEANLRAALEPPSAGAVLYSWSDVQSTSGRTEIVRRVVLEQ